MKKFKSFIASLTAAVLLTGLAINFNACSEQSPVSTTENTTATRRAPGELSILKSKSGVSLNKLFVKEKLITVAGVAELRSGIESLEKVDSTSNPEMSARTYWLLSLLNRRACFRVAQNFHRMVRLSTIRWQSAYPTKMLI